TVSPPPRPERHRPARRDRPGEPFRGQAPRRPACQRWLLLLRTGRARLPERVQCAGARADGGPGCRRPAARLSPRRFLGLHGHLQGRGDAQRPLEGGGRSVEGVGVSGGSQSGSVFVTGAYGLLGTWLTKALLDAGAQVTVLWRDHTV